MPMPQLALELFDHVVVDEDEEASVPIDLRLPTPHPSGRGSLASPVYLGRATPREHSATAPQFLGRATPLARPAAAPCTP